MHHETASCDNVYVEKFCESISIHERKRERDREREKERAREKEKKISVETGSAFPERSFWRPMLDSASVVTCSSHLVIVHSLAAQMDKIVGNALALLADSRRSGKRSSRDRLTIIVIIVPTSTIGVGVYRKFMIISRGYSNAKWCDFSRSNAYDIVQFPLCGEGWYNMKSIHDAKKNILNYLYCEDCLRDNDVCRDKNWESVNENMNGLSIRSDVREKCSSEFNRFADESVYV